AMTVTMHFDGTLHVVIASEAKQSFTHKKRYLLKGAYEKTYKKKKFLYSNTITRAPREYILKIQNMSAKKTEAFICDTENKGFLMEFIESNITKRLIPRGLSWFGCMGGLSLVAFMIQLGTGIFLMFSFIPSAAEAVSSIQRVSHSVPYGWLIHRIHAVGPHVMIGMVISHMLRILFKGIYRHPRELHWVSGACLLILTFIMYYTGYLLSAGNHSNHSVLSMTSVYALHIAGIPLTMGLFMGMHFFMVRRTGIYEPL
ncbi:MAG: hypothetical protein E3K33_08280, partial [Candidatus Brocadia sp.]|nr:hypothetical protein [Candidatus Brocadia sp.]